MADRSTGDEVGLTSGVVKCQGRQAQRDDKCQDINTTEKELLDDRSSGCSGDDSGVADGADRTEHHRRQHDTKHNLHFHQENDVSYQLVPPDGGWGWMVVIGTFIITTLLGSLGSCFGVLFSGYLLAERSSSTTTAWIYNLLSFLWFMSGMLARPLTQEFGWRPVALSGSLMYCLGFIISAFTPNPSFLFFSISVMCGVGGGVVICQCFIIIPHYFERLRGLTYAIMMGGMSLGQFLVPPIARYLQDNYGFRGATLILGALMLHACIGVLFFHPYEWHQKMVPVEEEPEEYVPGVRQTKTKATESLNLTHKLVQSPSELSFVQNTGKAECDGNFEKKARVLGHLKSYKMNASSSKESSKCNSTQSLSFMGLESLATIPMGEQEKDHRKAQGIKEGILLIRVMKSTIKDLCELKSLRVCIICFADAVSINGLFNFIMMVPFAMLEAGFSKDTAAWCVSVSSGCNLVTRFIVTALSDYPRFNKRLAYLSGFVLIGVSISAFTIFNTVEWLLVAMVVYGLGLGTCLGLFAIVIIDVMGVERLASVFGATNFCVAIGFICIGPLIGFIRDVTQSYAIGMRVTAGMLLLGLVAWMFMGAAERIDRCREAAKTRKEALEGI